MPRNIENIQQFSNSVNHTRGIIWNTCGTEQKRLAQRSCKAHTHMKLPGSDQSLTMSDRCTALLT